MIKTRIVKQTQMVKADKRDKQRQGWIEKCEGQAMQNAKGMENVKGMQNVVNGSNMAVGYGDATSISLGVARRLDGFKDICDEEGDMMCDTTTLVSTKMVCR